MINKTLENYKAIPSSLQGALGLVASHFFASFFMKIFLNIYVFKINNSFLDLILFNLFFYTAGSFFYIATSFLLSKYEMDLKDLLGKAVLIIALSFGILFFSDGGIESVYVFILINAIGRGAFFNIFHAYEITYSKPKYRLFVSSMRGVNNMIISICVSSIIAFLFYFESSLPFGFSPYDIMFFLSSLVLINGYFVFSKKLESFHIPKKVELSSFKGILFKKGRKRIGLVYLAAGSTAVAGLLISMLSFYILKTELNVGIYELVFTIIGILFTLTLGNNLKGNGTYKVLVFASIFYFLSFLALAFFLNLYVYLAFSLISLILFPIIVSVVALYKMRINDILSEHNGNWYANLQYQEFMYAIGRVIIFAFFGLFVSFSGNISEILKYWVIFFGFIYLSYPILLFHIRKITKKNK